MESAGFEEGAAPAVVLRATGPHGDGGAPVVNPRWEAALRLRLAVLELLAALFGSGCDPRRRPGGDLTRRRCEQRWRDAGRRRPGFARQPG
jgi:hypothetical protein